MDQLAPNRAGKVTHLPRTLTPKPQCPAQLRLLSWNLLREDGADNEDIVTLINDTRPDIALFQEARAGIQSLDHMLGGVLYWAPFPNRHDGLAIWSRMPLAITTMRLPNQAPKGKPRRPRLTMLAHLPFGTIANIHLAHDQRLNRLQIAHILDATEGPLAIIGDTNAVGPTNLFSALSDHKFEDCGPKNWTHLAKGLLPLRLDRCLTRNWPSLDAAVLTRGYSDHRPIIVDLGPTTRA